jgi:hypothetical protein
MKHLILLALLVVGCSSGKNEKQSNTDPLSDIMDKRELYLSLVPEVQGVHGFITSHPTDCDSLLFTGLLVAAGGKANYRAAQDDRIPGRWYRTPFKDCYRNTQSGNNSGRKSGSTTSVDMLAGVLWAAYYSGDLAAAKDLINYGKKNKWFMGEPRGDRTFMWPPHRQTLYIVAGKKYGAEEIDFIDPIKDHARHVVALYIILEGEITGKLSDGNLDLLKKFSRLEPRNALFSYGVSRFHSGDFSKVLEVLRDENLFPPDRLPTAKDRCGRWLWERSMKHEAWRPCSNVKVHSGGDFLLISKLLEDARER